MPGLFTRWFGRAPPVDVAETRAGVAWQAAFMPADGSGYAISATMAENLATVTACINAITSGLASLPAYVYSRDGIGRTEAPEHPVARLIRAPNRRQTWPDFLECLLGSTLLHGNGLAWIESNGAGQPVALWPLPWHSVQPVVLPSGRMRFDVASHMTPWGGSGVPRRLLDSEVLHLRDRSDDGFLGRSRISRAPAVLTAAAGLQTFSQAIWDNAATPSGAIEVPPGITPAGLHRMEAHFVDRYAGARNARKPLFLDPGSKFTALSVSPEDAEVLASRRFTGEELARLFGVPPPIIGDLTHGSFQNSETAGRWFAQFTLAPWARKIEAEFGRSVFTGGDGAHMEVDLSGLMRGDYAARWQANVAAVEAGILLKNEVRELEGFNPLPVAAAAGGPPA